MPLQPRPIQLVRQTRPPPELPDNLSINDNYDPIVAIQQTAFGPLGTIGSPASDCYGLWPYPFTECEDLLKILEKDNRISAYYNLLFQNVTSQNISLSFVEGIVRSILGQAADMHTDGDRFITSVIGHISSNAYWQTPEGEKIGPTDSRYSDFSIDRTGWFYNGEPPTATEALLYNAYREAMRLFNEAISPIIPFDISGQSYLGDCVAINGLPFTYEYTDTQNTYGIPWVQAVRTLGPDAVRRNEFGGNYYDGNPNILEDATFFNMCLRAKECIKDYSGGFRDSYESDVAALTPEQLEILGITYTSNYDLSNVILKLNQSKAKIDEALAVALNTRYYTGISGITNPADFGIMHNEALYRVAISLLAFKNTVTIILESFVGNEVTSEVQEYNDYVDELLAQQEEEYEKRIEEEAERRLAKEIAEAERFKVCTLPPVIVTNLCADTRPLDAKSFVEDWTSRTNKETFYDTNLKKYFIVYDIVTINLKDLQTNAESYMLAAYSILDEKYKLEGVDLTLQSDVVEQNIKKFMQLEDIFLEPRAYKPSKILFSLDLIEMEKAKDGSIASPTRPRVGAFEPPEGEYIKAYSFTIQEFFESLEAFEGILKKYVFDYTLWKLTFGNESLAVQNLAVSVSSVFNKLKIGILKQDSKNFQNFRPIFTKLLSKNGVSVKPSVRAANIGDYTIDDRIILTFTFSPAAGAPTPQTVLGSNIVSNTPPNTSTTTPTKSSGSGLAEGMIGGSNIRLFRIQVKSASRPPVDLIWKSDDPFSSELDGINNLEAFRQETAMNYLMNLDTILNYLLPNKNDRV